MLIIHNLVLSDDAFTTYTIGFGYVCGPGI